MQSDICNNDFLLSSGAVCPDVLSFTSIKQCNNIKYKKHQNISPCYSNCGNNLADLRDQTIALTL